MVNIKRKVNVIEDIDGRKTVFIHDIIFKGKRSVKWEDVEKYLKQYVGDIYTIDDSNDTVYIGTDLPDEYTHSNYTHILRGANAKAKANAAQGLPELIEIAAGKKYTENHKEKHTRGGKFYEECNIYNFNDTIISNTTCWARKYIHRWNSRTIKKIETFNSSNVRICNFIFSLYF